jgi:predicted glycosyltransferase
MNREAAALGVPVYSTFRGPIGAVDRYLAAKGRLVLLESVAEVRERIALTKRKRPDTRSPVGRGALDAIVGHVVAMARLDMRRTPSLKGGGL